MIEWQPIETAPKDETWVMIYSKQLGTPPFAIAFWSEKDAKWFDVDWKFHSIFVGLTITHWMPLPEPPPTAV
jgi:hypothetical protein